jgi:hypothetical protein
VTGSHRGGGGDARRGEVLSACASRTTLNTTAVSTRTAATAAAHDEQGAAPLGGLLSLAHLLDASLAVLVGGLRHVIAPG